MGLDDLVETTGGQLDRRHNPVADRFAQYATDAASPARAQA